MWTTASRQRVRVWDADSGSNVDSGPFRQVSRLGNPLFNEVLIPISKKDLWNSLPPSDDKQFARFVTHPELAALLPVLYPGVFPKLAALVKSGKPRADLEAILLTGIPTGIIPGFTNFTGPVLADMFRLNTSIPPTPASKQSIYGLLGGDAAGFPNGRRVTDDMVAIELRAIAGGHLRAGRQVQTRRRRKPAHRRADPGQRQRTPTSASSLTSGFPTTASTTRPVAAALFPRHGHRSGVMCRFRTGSVPGARPGARPGCTDARPGRTAGAPVSGHRRSTPLS